jgi:putative nucleotidyltransferase with HDIG domain
MRCPGQDPMFWKPGDVFEIPCPKCGYRVEFFKYDVKRKCRCGHEIVNPKIDFGCAQWCPYGDSCIEGLPEDMKAKTREEKNARLRERIAFEMKRYFGQDVKSINHAINTAKYADEILRIEGGNPIVVFGGAYLHDSGKKNSKEKYGSSANEFHEKEGAEVAREILIKLNVPRGLIDEICDIISHHHHPKSNETLNFQIVYEADCLVNIESGFSNEMGERRKVDLKNFKTKTGKRLAEELFSKIQI